MLIVFLQVCKTFQSLETKQPTRTLILIRDRAANTMKYLMMKNMIFVEKRDFCRKTSFIDLYSVVVWEQFNISDISVFDISGSHCNWLLEANPDDQDI